MSIDVTRDQAGLRTAVREMLERSFAESRVRRSMFDAGDEGAERIYGSLPPLTLSPGYYRRAEFLLWLEKRKEQGLVAAPWLLAESDGLVAVAEARGEFERLHPSCGVCGALQESQFATSCCGCGTQFARRSAA
jgi:hypothetical protein